MNFAEMLKLLRKQKQITQYELADATGLKRSAISMYEAGKREPDFETAEIFADYFNVDLDKLMGRHIPSLPSPRLTDQEEELLSKFRSLDEENQEEVMDYIDLRLAKYERSVKKDEERLG